MKYLFPIVVILVSCTNDRPSDRSIFDKDKSQKEISTLIDNWHHAATIADEDVFFGSISNDGIYLGTDKTERWAKQIFQEWSKKYFERDTAWAFTPYDRTIYFAQDGDVAWFEESLETWMGHCRGSGVVQKNDSLWKIEHYNLAVTIDNDKIDGFIELTQAEKD